MELTILMPCLNEAETLAVCIRKARTFLEENHVDGEVLISDNGSTDGSREIAAAEGARVVMTPERGYGSALIYGTKAARGTYVIMGDADDSYDFLHLMPFLEKLREGYELVMGDRFAGGIEKGAMPFSHQYIGNPVLSFLGRLFYKSDIRDFHCGLRGYDREAFLRLDLCTTGMEYASEMVVMAQLHHLKITEVPTTLKKDGRSGRPHLRSIRDGLRHLKFLLTYAPHWLFILPGILLLLAGTGWGAAVLVSRRTEEAVPALLYCMGMIAAGQLLLNMYRVVRVYAYNHLGPLWDDGNWNERIPEDRLFLWGGIMILIGLLLSIAGLAVRKDALITAVAAVLLLQGGVQNVAAGFLVGIVKTRPVYGQNANREKRSEHAAAER